MFEDLKMTIEYWPIDKLIPYARNPRKNDQAVDKAASWIKEFGFRVPVLAKSDGSIVDGHLRLKAAKKLGITQIPVSLADDMTEVQIKAFRLSVNRMSELADWDDDLLKLELEELDNLQYDIDSLGFDDIKIDKHESNDGLTDPDEVPEVPQNLFNVKRGDIWLLGNYRLMCGDSTSEDDVKKLMDGQKADMAFTSPPYNGNTHIWYGPNRNSTLYQNNEGDNKESEEYINFLQVVLKNIFENTVGFIFWNINYNNKSRHEYLTHLTPYLARLWETIIWKKTGMPISNGLTRNCEFIFVFKNGERKHLGKEFNTINNLWEVSNINSQHKEHKACFPVELPEKGILIGSNEKERVLEPFCGSGSTLIACEKTGRTCFGMELDEHYCSVIIKRWQDFTGKQAERV